MQARSIRNDKEINPDVRGYIFEKYINQKQMGAYYTKEDIIDYICKNVIIPYLLDAVRREQPAAFDASADLDMMLAQLRSAGKLENFDAEAQGRKGVHRERGRKFAASEDFGAASQTSKDTPRENEGDFDASAPSQGNACICD